MCQNHQNLLILFLYYLGKSDLAQFSISYSPFIWGPKETAFHSVVCVPLSTTCRVLPPIWVVHRDQFNCWWFPHLTIPHRCLLLITSVGHDWPFASMIACCLPTLAVACCSFTTPSPFFKGPHLWNYPIVFPMIRSETTSIIDIWHFHTDHRYDHCIFLLSME